MSETENVERVAPRRKPLLKRKPTGKFQIRDFQREDIAYLSEIPHGCALWSEMGTFKTSTVEWLLEQKTKHIPNPRVLVITTKTGKGPYMESLWETLPEWDVFNIAPKKTSLILGSRVAPWSVRFPNPLYMRPVIALAHYNCFTNRQCIPQQKQETVTLENGKKVKRPVLLPNGTIDMIIPKCNWLLHAHWDIIIVDEAHRIKNHDAQWTRNIKKLKAAYKIIMTGTGFVNNPAEVWSLLDFLYSGQRAAPHANIVNGTGYWKFREYFCDEDYDKGYRKIVGIKWDKEEEFRQLVRDVGVRRTMLECFPDIGVPIETEVPVDLSPYQRKMYNDLVEELWALDAKGVPLQSPNVLSLLTRLRQVTGAQIEVDESKPSWNEKLQRRETHVTFTEPSSKLDAVMDVLDGMEWDAERRDQVVVFSAFKGPLDLLAKRLDAQYDSLGRLKREAIPYLHMKAEMGEKERYNLWHDTWWKKEHMVFLSTLDLGAESINLASAHRAIFIDQLWSPAKNKQAIGRVYRPGQTQTAQLIYIRARDTVDYRVLDAVNTKHSWFRSIFGGGAAEETEEETNGSEDGESNQETVAVSEGAGTEG